MSPTAIPSASASSTPVITSYSIHYTKLYDRVGMYEFDRRLAFINLADAQKLYRKGDTVTGVRLAVTDIYAAPEIVREVAQANGRNNFV